MIGFLYGKDSENLDDHNRFNCQISSKTKAKKKKNMKLHKPLKVTQDYSSVSGVQRKISNWFTVQHSKLWRLCLLDRYKKEFIPTFFRSLWIYHHCFQCRGNQTSDITDLPHSSNYILSVTADEITSIRVPIKSFFLPTEFFCKPKSNLYPESENWWSRHFTMRWSIWFSAKFHFFILTTINIAYNMVPVNDCLPRDALENKPAPISSFFLPLFK